MSEIHVLDYIVLVALMVSSLAIGIYHAYIGRRQTNEDFLMGGRKMSVFPVVLSLLASFMSSNNVLGHPAYIYSKGTQLWVQIISITVSTVVAAEIFLPIFYRLKLTSVNTYIYERFQSKLLLMVATMSICVSMIPWMGIVLFSPSLALTSITNLSTTSCILITGLVVTIYTSVGGIKAVIWTDVLQSILMVTGVVTLITMGIINTGGFKEVWNRSLDGGRIIFFNFDFNVYMSNNFWIVLIGSMIVTTGALSTSQMLVQRTCTLPTVKKAKQVIYISMPGFQIMFSMVCFMGLVIFANYYKCDPVTAGLIERVDQIVPYFASNVLKSVPGFFGVFIACIWSASLSTLSSGLNALAALLWEDIISKLFPNSTPKKAVIITKLIAATVGGLCIVMALLCSQIGTIFEASFALTGTPVGPTFATFLLGLFAPFVNASGALSGLVCGQMFCLLINVGAIVNKYKKGSLLSATEGCDPNWFLNSTRPMIPFSSLKQYQIPNYKPEGINHLFHLSYFIVPCVGFLVTMFIAIFVSLITGCNRQQKVNPGLLNEMVVKLLKLERKCEKKVKSIKESQSFL